MLRERVAEWLYNTDAKNSPAIPFAKQDDNVRNFYLVCAKELLATIAEELEEEDYGRAAWFIRQGGER